MNTKAIITATLLSALFAGQTAFAGQDKDQTVFAELEAKTVVSNASSSDKVRYDAPTVDTQYDVVSGRK
ncbi:hypothetical protein OO007_17695 [Cocleimonas sp. KMM 6892]|jgi:hypothetical protein|uniref:hypothetical protein n=1 Tax=unclassified Cocleimonas TaxID=2639732 RepID=UPI002DBCE00D|nr:MULTISPECIES: hypothetical protein [unclassified Cocleimonas]MEB8434078.1 hypothetical protein [Cocleimonas sp. KMM 6892]MEC4717062.1 hypothetical protein [Cocleimonas sp. KMM 6895]MEC4746350.1 hypothetical protein [Cocleimonas sp. KMM 6896]